MKLVSTTATLLTLLTVMVCLSWPQGNQALAPGPLSTAHAQLLSTSGPHGLTTIDSKNRCAACHPTGDSSSKTLLADASGQFLPVSTKTTANKQSKLCMDCHLQTMPNGLYGNPHDLTGEDLKALFETVSASPPKSIAKDNTECSQCHREHQGADGQLQLITSAQCQACHRKQFDSFSHGHPDFANYPADVPRSIAFDHARHMELHFSKKGKAFDCQTCHLHSNEKSLVGNVFRSVSFERACAECHAGPMKTASTEGIVVFQVPSLDRNRLASAGYELGAWPDSASQLMDGTLSPMIVAFLRSSNEGQRILKALPESGRLNDVDLNSPEQCANIVALAEQARNFWKRLATEGQPLLRTTMQNALETELGSQSSHSNSRFVSTSPLPTAMAHPTSATLAFGDVRDSTASRWLDQVSSGLPPDLVRMSADAWFTSVSTHPSQAAKRTFELTKTASPIALRLGQPKQAEDDDDLLVGNDELLDPSKKPDLLAKPANPVVETASTKSLKPWEHLPFGGWMIDEMRVALVYVPKGHADEWVSRWIEWQVMGNGVVPERMDSFSRQCLQCHSFDKHRVMAMLQSKDLDDWFVAFQSKANRESLDDSCWRIRQRSNAQRELTRFNHTPHMTMSSLRDCQSCHKLIALDKTQVSAKVWSHYGRSVHHEFEYMSINQCANCHTKHSAGDWCTQCHNYHVHGFRASKDVSPFP